MAPSRRCSSGCARRCCEATPRKALKIRRGRQFQLESRESEDVALREEGRRISRSRKPMMVMAHPPLKAKIIARKFLQDSGCIGTLQSWQPRTKPPRRWSLELIHELFIHQNTL